MRWALDARLSHAPLLLPTTTVSRNILPMIAPEVLDLVVYSREAIFSFAATVAFRAVNESLLMRRLVMSGHVCLAGELFSRPAVRIQAIWV
jgi:hypothetical protein